MPSTYSPSLRIELIANGEQSGTWGSTTNVNLGTLIESAISGYVSVSITTANQALTALDGVADQSRNMVVNLTTTTSASFNVYIPPAEKVYIIRNSSAYDATIYCSTSIGNTTAAGAGASVPAGRTTLIFADGTIVVSGMNFLPSLNLTTALNAISGGTGQSSYTVGDLLFASGSTALSKLADVATGNVLLSGGVGVAPSYGKVGMATHVSGVLPVDNGGTGAATLTNGAILKGAGTSPVTTATAGTDYLAPPSGTAIMKANSGGALANAVDGTDYVSPTGAATLTNKTLDGPIINNGYTEEVFAVTGTTPALSPTNGSIQTWTLSGASTPTAGTWASGQSILLMIDDGTAYTVTWSSLSVVWKTTGGAAPSLLTTGYTPIVLWKVDSIIYGAQVGNA